VRKLHEIAKEVLGDIHRVQMEDMKTPNWVHYALPYLDAMCYLRTPADMYGLEYGDMIVARFLNNASYWRGETARRIKAELNDILKDYNEHNKR